MAVKKAPATRVVLKNVRISYVHLITPQEGGEDGSGVAKFGLTCLIDKKTPGIKGVLDAAIMAATAKGWPNGGMDPFKQRNKPVRDGDTDETNAGKSGYAGCWFINPRSEERPECVDRDGNVMGMDKLPQIYSGCYCTVIVDAFPYGQKPGSKQKGVGWGFSVVQKIRDGDRLDNRASVADLPPVDEYDTGEPTAAGDDDW